MGSIHSKIERSIDCSELYEEAITLFSYHDDELEKAFRLTKPVFNSKVIISLNEKGEEEYSVETLLFFPFNDNTVEIVAYQKIMEQKFREIENIVDLESRLHDLPKSKSDREAL
jgi:hypothetical protein